MNNLIFAIKIYMLKKSYFLVCYFIFLLTARWLSTKSCLTLIRLGYLGVHFVVGRGGERDKITYKYLLIVSTYTYEGSN